IYDLVPPSVIRSKSTNSWTTIAFIEGLARNIRRTLSSGSGMRVFIGSFHSSSRTFFRASHVSKSNSI
ncbi:MAG TPA: hypothetical protein VF961_07520, partial [Pyrinomonadaceae bacterium]